MNLERLMSNVVFGAYPQPCATSFTNTEQRGDSSSTLSQLQKRYNEHHESLGSFKLTRRGKFIRPRGNVYKRLLMLEL